jgi:DNA (cytosine-5)-methyltransferase 1
MTTYNRKIGQNKGKPRLWLEGDILATNGFAWGTRYNVTPSDGVITITRIDDGKRKVAGKAVRPVIDILNGALPKAFSDMHESVTIEASEGKLIVKREGILK